MNLFPRISFGIIVLNGEPFTRYTLRMLYPFAHQIIVVEGAAPAAANVATSDGHSTDGTLEALHRFKAEEDPEDKLQIVTRDGFWTEKDEMSQAYAERATGDYLWQIDVDEFYKAEDMQFILKMLRDDPDITAVSFRTITFWGSPDYVVDGWYLRRGAEMYHRLFKWGNGYQYVTHRPPTVVDEQGRDLRTLKWVNGHQLSKKGIIMYHYSLLFPKQVMAKSNYYGKAFAHTSGGDEWAHQNYIQLINPFRVHNVYKSPSWLQRFKGEHPEQMKALWAELVTRQGNLELRQIDDIEKLLNTYRYQAGRWIIKHLDYWNRFNRFTLKFLSRTFNTVKNIPKRLSGN